MNVLQAQVVNSTAGTYNDTLPTSFLTMSASNFTQKDLDYVTSLTTKQTINEKTEEYCGPEWLEFRLAFMGFHSIASMVVCVFGLITNILNIIVLSRKDMASSTNLILTGLAVADMLVMIDYMPFTIHTYVLADDNPNDCHRYTYGWAVFTLVHAHLTVVCHTISIGLTVTLAVWRFIAVRLPQNNMAWCNMERARWAIASCYVFSPIFCVPVYLAFEIQDQVKSCSEGHNATVYHIKFSRIAKKNNRFLEKLNFWVYSVLIKILPCIALTVLSLCLIRALYEANRRHIMLHARNPENVDRSCDRTTRMLLAVLILFLFTEFPQGILALLSGILGEQFFENCYGNLSEVMDLLALINSAINFILYYVMSRQFRHACSQIFKASILNSWIASPPQEGTTTMGTTCV